MANCSAPAVSGVRTALGDEVQALNVILQGADSCGVPFGVGASNLDRGHQFGRCRVWAGSHRASIDLLNLFDGPPIGASNRLGGVALPLLTGFDVIGTILGSSGRTLDLLGPPVARAHVRLLVAGLWSPSRADITGQRLSKELAAKVRPRGVQLLEAYGGCAENVRAVCIEFPYSDQAGIDWHLSCADLTFDEFHVIQMVNRAIDDARREAAKSTPTRKRSRYLWRTNTPDHPPRDVIQYAALERLNLKTHRAFRIEEALREIYRTAPNRETDKALLWPWYRCARCPLCQDSCRPDLWRL